MNTGTFRPVFELRAARGRQEATSAILGRLQSSPENVEFKVVGDHIVVNTATRLRHFWSPWLNLEIGGDEAETVVHGRFSPHPSVWTAFMFSWLSTFVLFFFSLVLGVSQQILESTPWGYWLVPLWGLIALGLWVGSRIGQGLSRSEMETMMALVESGLAEAKPAETPVGV